MLSKGAVLALDLDAQLALGAPLAFDLGSLLTPWGTTGF